MHGLLFASSYIFIIARRADSLCDSNDKDNPPTRKYQQRDFCGVNNSLSIVNAVEQEKKSTFHSHHPSTRKTIKRLSATGMKILFCFAGNKFNKFSVAWGWISSKRAFVWADNNMINHMNFNSVQGWKFIANSQSNALQWRQRKDLCAFTCHCQSQKAFCSWSANVKESFEHSNQLRCFQGL